MTAAVRAALDALVGELCAEAKTDPRDVLELVFVGNPIMHHLLLGIDPVELGGAPFALATDSAHRAAGPRARPAQRSTRAPGSTSCPASPAMSVPTARASCCRRRPSSTTRSRSSSTSAPTPRSCWATATGCSPAPRPPARPSRVPRSATASGRRRGRSSGCGSTATRWSRASRSSAATSGRTSRASPRPPRRTGVTGICGSGIIEALAEMYLAGLITTRRRRRRRHGRAQPSACGPTGRTFGYLLHAGEPEIAVTRTTSAPSSWPRPRSMPARAC